MSALPRPCWPMLATIVLLAIFSANEPATAQKLEVRVCARGLPRGVDKLSLAVAISRHRLELFTGSYDVWGWVPLREGQCQVASRGKTVRAFLPPGGAVYLFAVARDAAGTLRRVPLAVGREDHVGPSDKRFCIRQTAFERVVDRRRIGRECPEGYHAVHFPLRFSRKLEGTWDGDIDRSWLTLDFTIDDPQLAEVVAGPAPSTAGSVGNSEGDAPIAARDRDDAGAQRRRQPRVRARNRFIRDFDSLLRVVLAELPSGFRELRGEELAAGDWNFQGEYQLDVETPFSQPYAFEGTVDPADPGAQAAVYIGYEAPEDSAAAWKERSPSVLGLLGLGAGHNPFGDFVHMRGVIRDRLGGSWVEVVDDELFEALWVRCRADGMADLVFLLAEATGVGVVIGHAPDSQSRGQCR